MNNADGHVCIGLHFYTESETKFFRTRIVSIIWLFILLSLTATFISLQLSLGIPRHGTCHMRRELMSLVSVWILPQLCVGDDYIIIIVSDNNSIFCRHTNAETLINHNRNPLDPKSWLFISTSSDYWRATEITFEENQTEEKSNIYFFASELSSYVILIVPVDRWTKFPCDKNHLSECIVQSWLMTRSISRTSNSTCIRMPQTFDAQYTLHIHHLVDHFILERSKRGGKLFRENRVK